MLILTVKNLPADLSDVTVRDFTGLEQSAVLSMQRVSLSEPIQSHHEKLYSSAKYARCSSAHIQTCQQVPVGLVGLALLSSPALQVSLTGQDVQVVPSDPLDLSVLVPLLTLSGENTTSALAKRNKSGWSSNDLFTELNIPLLSLPLDLLSPVNQSQESII